jgi:hypothetical protein
MSEFLQNAGRYPATVTKAELGESPTTGTEFLQLTFETDEGFISRRLYMSEKAFPYSLKNLTEVFAFDGDFTNLDQLIGKHCSITVDNEIDDSGKDRLAVKWINTSGGPKLDDGKKKSIADRLSAMAKGSEPF